MKVWLFSVAVLLSTFGKADAMKEPEICYVLDAVLFVYGIVLTILYCHLKMKMRKQEQKLKAGAQVYEKEESVYTGLQARSQETYETIQLQEKPN